MKTWKMVTAIGLAVIGIALVTASVFAYMGASGVNSPYGTYPNGAVGGQMGGMMGGYSYGYSAQPNQATPTTPAYPYQYGAGGCHGGVGWNGYAAPAYATNGTAVTIDDAVAIAQNYVTSLNNPDLAIGEVEEYSLNFYVQVYEKSTGIGAFEMLIDKYTGSIYAEQGPNMMWNTKYGMLSVNGYTGQVWYHNWHGAFIQELEIS